MKNTIVRAKDPQLVALRFWAKVDKSGECWQWTAGKRSGGYGVFYDGAKLVAAHRYSYGLTDAIPDGMMVLHECDNPACVRPSHLRLGDGSTNLTDASLKGRLGRRPRSANRPPRAPHVKRLLEVLGTQQAVADVLGISRSRVGQLLHDSLT